MFTFVQKNSMFQNASSFFRNIAGWKSFLPAMALYLFFGAYVMPNGAKKFSELSGQEVKILDLQFSYSPEKAKQIISEYSDEARSYAVQFGLIADTFYPVAYTLILVITIAWLFKKPDSAGTALQHIHMMPFATMVVDYFENIFIAFMHIKYPYVADVQIYISSTLTSLKWSLAIVSFLILLAGLVRKFSTKQVQ